MAKDNQKINEIITNQKLKPTDKLILLYLSSTLNIKFSNNDIANKLNISRPTIIKVIKHLKDLNYIKVGNIMDKSCNGNPFITKRYVKNINWKKINKDA